MRPALRSLAARLCLIASLWIGLTPRAGYVVCLEPSGGIDLETSVSGRCVNCPDDCDATVLPAPSTCEMGDCRSADGMHPAREKGGCDCVDIPLLGSSEQRVPVKSSPLEHDELAVLAPADDAMPSVCPAVLLPASRRATERPPPWLGNLRTVVLRL